MKRIATIVVAAFIAGAAPNQAAQLNAASTVASVTAGTIAVKIDYKGKGTIDGSHRVWVWLFGTPDIGPGSMPIAEVSISKNGEVAIFEGVGADKVWIAAAFDEQGVMQGQAPPPSGSPVGVFVGVDGAPAGVVPGAKDAVLTFDDSFRMP